MYRVMMFVKEGSANDLTLSEDSDKATRGLAEKPNHNIWSGLCIADHDLTCI